ncbi:F-box domain containing protein [Pandoravirus neocaledonia]|uniref:F-box domain containing protein n=1 Tax=Pandoravirus neocaledonia TaxID=2107708 RepID=A0A2U7UDU6_9VIRU|nr:F-box domain containing protein [Pandoravirus neocaledonia]AVK76607.1 F-box domain containing protein [Pandoravirus neocaledonia]
MDIASDIITLADLPDEIILDIAALVPTANVVMLSATCRALRGLTTCESLWRRLFVRDYAHLYEKGLPARPWPHRDHPDDPWHEMAVDFWNETDAIACMPPRCPPLPDLPAPFAHVFAAGKDWRWLYRVHASTIPKGCTDFTGTATYQRNSTKILCCDWINGTSIGYVSTITTDSAGDTIIKWSEDMRCLSDGAACWSVRCDANEIAHQGRSVALGRNYLFSSRRDGDRRWVAFGDSGPGAFVGISRLRMRYDGCMVNGATISITRETIDGRIVKPIRHGKVHGVVHNIWHNGDVMDTRYEDNKFIEVVDFVFSPTCPHRDYAGVKIADRNWRAVDVVVKGEPFSVYVPEGDSDDVRLFWRYVADGLIGWHPDIRRVVLDMVAGGCL